MLAFRSLRKDDRTGSPSPYRDNPSNFSMSMPYSDAIVLAALDSTVDVADFLAAGGEPVEKRSHYMG
jgi:hypothetical protein